MKQQRMPVLGGATPFYSGDEDSDEVFEEGDYRIGKLDVGRKEISRVIAERNTQTADIPNPNEDAQKGE